MISREVILDPEATQSEVEDGSPAEELSGKPGSDPEEEKLAHSVLEHDDQTVRDGKMLAESIDYAVGSFTPDMIFEQLTKHFRNAKRLYGETVIRELTGYDSEYIEKNLNVEEFKQQIQERIEGSVERLKKQNLLDDDGRLTEEGVTLASLVLYTEELDHLQAHGLGRKDVKRHAHYGEQQERTRYDRQRYKDIDIRATIRKALRRGHTEITREDLVARERQQRGKVSIMYALDASGSMRGRKLHMGKKAGVALSFRAIDDGNEAGLIVFTDEISHSTAPCRNFPDLLRALTIVRAGHETNLALAIEHATQLFPKKGTKHLVLLTDALPTSGEEPGDATLHAVSAAKDQGVTISLVGINLEKEGETLAKEIVEVGEGKLYRVKDLEELDLLILEDYETFRG